MGKARATAALVAAAAAPAGGAGGADAEPDMDADGSGFEVVLDGEDGEASSSSSGQSEALGGTSGSTGGTGAVARGGSSDLDAVEQQPTANGTGAVAATAGPANGGLGAAVAAAEAAARGGARNGGAKGGGQSDPFQRWGSPELLPVAERMLGLIQVCCWGPPLEAACWVWVWGLRVAPAAWHALVLAEQAILWGVHMRLCRPRRLASLTPLAPARCGRCASCWRTAPPRARSCC